MTDTVLQINGLDKLKVLVNKYPASSEKFVYNAIEVTLKLIQNVARSNAPIGVTHNLQNQWKVEMGRFQGKLSSEAQYSMAVEQGTRPHFVPIEAIRPWAEKKGIPPWAVKRSIEAHGTKANPFFKKSLDYVKPQVNKIFSGAISNIIEEIKK